MKNILFLFLITVAGCSFKVGDNNANQQEQRGAEYTSVYVCPMHCEGSGSDTAGTCPVCGMDYVINNENE